mgnify:CR=1 FL=1
MQYCSRTALLTDAFDDLEILKDKIINIEKTDVVETKKSFAEIFISLLIIFISIFTIVFITRPIKD